MGIENEIETMPSKAPTDEDEFLYVDSPSLPVRKASRYTWGGLATAAAKHSTNLVHIGPFFIMPAIGDDLTTGTAKVTFRMPFALTVTEVRASATVASSSGIPTFDINMGGTTIMAVTKLTIDADELTSTTAAAAAVVSVTALTDDALMTIDVDVAGTGCKGAKVLILGYKT